MLRHLPPSPPPGGGGTKLGKVLGEMGRKKSKKARDEAGKMRRKRFQKGAVSEKCILIFSSDLSFSLPLLLVYLSCVTPFFLLLILSFCFFILKYLGSNAFQLLFYSSCWFHLFIVFPLSISFPPLVLICGTFFLLGYHLLNLFPSWFSSNLGFSSFVLI
jgi:hypothetical protein